MIGKARSGSFRETLSGQLNSIFSTKNKEEEFWALKDVSFEVKKGEVLGVIGRNGAGKSTLLKILSRITEPTTGRVELNGRVASLLEVGTGFHPELTGRENIFLNGALLGMARQEIKSKFDEIVDFSGVEQFIDTPVKKYSSGMYVRLAFAVAAHLESEILLVDEVLAVGDFEFQRKCMGKMEDVASCGKTVLIVSHNMALIQKLSSKGILLNNGRLEKWKSVGEIIDLYVNSINEQSSRIIGKLNSQHDDIEIQDILVNNSDSPHISLHQHQTNLNIEIKFFCREKLNLSIGAILYDRNKMQIGFFSPGHMQPEKFILIFDPGEHKIVGNAQLPLLNKGIYYLTIIVHLPGLIGYMTLDNAVTINHQGSPTESGFVFDQHKNGYFIIEGTIQQN